MNKTKFIDRHIRLWTVLGIFGDLISQPPAFSLTRVIFTVGSKKNPVFASV
jgi:hypothetical protein